MDLKTGRVVWKYQAIEGDIWNAACIYGNPVSCPTPVGPDTDFGATTMLLNDGEGSILVAGAKSGYLHAFDAAGGELVWKIRVARGGPEAGIRYGMTTRDGILYVPSTDQGKEEISGMTARPGLFAIRAEDGSLLWRATTQTICNGRADCDGAIGAPPTATEEVVFAAGMNGSVHAFARETGKRIWHFDTAQEFETLAGSTTRGGGISGTAGPMVANGRLFVSSGYGQAQRPGNALIAFEPRSVIRSD
jgi:polyvinyl alcohol dehydrogenase (cytochrome)